MNANVTQRELGVRTGRRQVWALALGQITTRGESFSMSAIFSRAGLCSITSEVLHHVLERRLDAFVGMVLQREVERELVDDLRASEELRRMSVE